ncbi:ABC-type transport auxiliary lipoprotein family protein [Utexia brackfieldae]|uniref:ABC-type transport auxiliary lipoprotein family protein n=1 Tax=Utexia brackfieldae TaxID=3074108 RepID=UPI00370D50D9
MKKIWVLLSMWLLVSCSSSLPQKNYYLLTHGHQSSVKPAAIETVNDFIWIAPVNIANFLNKDGLVYQTDPYQYVTATNNLWASPLVAQLQEQVVSELSALLPQRLVSAAPLATPTATVKLFISGFHGSYLGDVIIEGYWIIMDDQGRTQRKNFSYQLPQTADGYDAMVKTLSQGWYNEVQDLVNKVKL